MKTKHLTKHRPRWTARKHNKISFTVDRLDRLDIAICKTTTQKKAQKTIKNRLDRADSTLLYISVCVGEFAKMRNNLTCDIYKRRVCPPVQTKKRENTPE
jgi:hypothetical protein